tara:strand:+ start:329 stop:1516 length:1188 start_codon:yes stop_codon:yes gene_type:complete
MGFIFKTHKMNLKIIKLKLLVKYIFFSRYVFKLPTKKKILIYDDNNVRFLSKFFHSNDFSILYTRGEEFNFIILFKNFLRAKFSKKEYFETYINYVDPNILITFSDNDKTFLLIKKSSVKKVIIQNAWKTEQDDHILRNINVRKDKAQFNLDCIFVFNKDFGEKYKKLTGCKYFVIGSFKSNLIKINLKKKYDILYISSWADIKEDTEVSPNISWKKFNLTQTKLIKYLFNYSKKNNLSFHIYGKMISNKLAKLENQYFQNILGAKNLKFIKGNRRKTYDIIDKAKINITLNSTLGYESLTRGTKTIFFSLRPKKEFLSSLRFGWPSKIPAKGFFWTNNLNTNYCDKMMNKVINSNKTVWLKEKKKYRKKLMFYDENNSIFRNHIKKIINDKNTL